MRLDIIRLADSRRRVQEPRSLSPLPHLGGPSYIVSPRDDGLPCPRGDDVVECELSTMTKLIAGRTDAMGRLVRRLQLCGMYTGLAMRGDILVLPYLPCHWQFNDDRRMGEGQSGYASKTWQDRGDQVSLCELAPSW